MLNNQFDKDELISIIVPVYNVENYLFDCIESILNQTYDHFELILINDGSTDNSVQICEDFQKKDSRIVLINQKNSGVSAARNAGLKLSKGEYITFIDSDDTVDTRYLEILYRNIKKVNADISFCRWNCVRNEHVIDKEKIEVWDRNQTFFGMFKTKKIDGSVCSKLYRKQCIQNLVFDTKLRLGEDQIFAVQAIERINVTVFQNIPLYTYYIRNTSAMNSPLDSRYWDNVYRAEWLISEAENSIPEMNDLFRKEELNIYVTMIIRHIKSGTDESKKIVDYIWPRVKCGKMFLFIKYSTCYEFFRFMFVKYLYPIAYLIVKSKKKIQK